MNERLEIPSSYCVGQEINWEAPWIESRFWVELPFWLMVGNTTVSVEFEGRDFEITIHENYFELHVGALPIPRKTSFIKAH